MANKNNKYKVYRKYTTDDNGISWVETDEYRIVLVEENSKDCITETPTNTRWVETTGYICANKNKYAKEIKQISTDGGKTWTDTGEYRQGKLIEENSKDCGYTEVQYRWVVVNDPTKYVCVGTEKHKMEIRQLSNDGGITWVNVSPEETRASDEIIERYSLDCGGTIKYKWVDTGFECGSNLPSDSKIFIEAPGELTKETVFRWVVAEGADDYICEGNVKYYLYVKQQSTDGGKTWSEVQPRETQKGTIMNNNSYDCTPSDTGVTAERCETIVTYNDGTTKEFSINGIISSNSIENISAATKIDIGTCATEIDYAGFEKCKLLEYVRIPSSIKLIPTESFRSCNKLRQVILPNNLSGIGWRAFEDCFSLEGITIPDFVKDSFSNSEFAGCDNLASVKLGCGITSIYYYAFAYCLSFVYIKFPSSLVSIDTCAFIGCKNLQTIVFPNSIKKLGSEVFKNCINLKDIIYDGATSQWNAIKKDKTWNEGVPATVVHCTDGDVNL